MLIYKPFDWAHWLCSPTLIKWARLVRFQPQPRMKMDEEKKSLFRKFRRWFIVQKYTLARGYSHLHILMLGFVAAASVKSVVPWLINTTWKFLILVVLGFIGLFCVGWLDKKFGFLATENDYVTTSTPSLMEVINDVRNKKDKSSLPSDGKDI